MAAARWTRTQLAAVAAGGALGAGARWALLRFIEPPAFPWPVLAINVAGSFLLGVLLAEEARTPRVHVALHDLGAIGFCGGLTTFSTFAVDTVELIERGDGARAAGYALASVVLAVAALLAGAALLRRLRAAVAPVEEEP